MAKTFLDQLIQSSSEYKEKMKMGQNILSKLQLITSTEAHDKPATTDKFEEIKKYKNLLDEGIISQEDFENKKKELLNLQTRKFCRRKLSFYLSNSY